MELNELTQVFQQVLQRVEVAGISLGLDVLTIAENLAREFKAMGLDVVHAAETGEVQHNA